MNYDAYRVVSILVKFIYNHAMIHGMRMHLFEIGIPYVLLSVFHTHGMGGVSDGSRGA